MVDPVGAKPVSSVRGLASLIKASPVRAAPSATSAADETSSSSIAVMAKDMSATAPVDVDRVARIRRAIADGSFPISPATVADHLIALKNNWNPNDAS